MVANQTYTIRWNNGRDLDLGQDGEQEKWASAMKNREYIVIEAYVEDIPCWVGNTSRKMI